MLCVEERRQISSAVRRSQPSRAHVFDGAAKGARGVHRGQLLPKVLHSRRKDADTSFRASGGEVERARIERDGPGFGCERARAREDQPESIDSRGEQTYQDLVPSVLLLHRPC